MVYCQWKAVCVFSPDPALSHRHFERWLTQVWAEMTDEQPIEDNQECCMGDIQRQGHEQLSAPLWPSHHKMVCSDSVPALNTLKAGAPASSSNLEFSEVASYSIQTFPLKFAEWVNSRAV